MNTQPYSWWVTSWINILSGSESLITLPWHIIDHNNLTLTPVRYILTEAIRWLVMLSFIAFTATQETVCHWAWSRCLMTWSRAGWQVMVTVTSISSLTLMTRHGDSDQHLITDSENQQVLVIDGQGHVNRRYKDEIHGVKLGNPWEITTAGQGRVLIVDHTAPCTTDVQEERGGKTTAPWKIVGTIICMYGWGKSQDVCRCQRYGWSTLCVCLWLQCPHWRQNIYWEDNQARHGNCNANPLSAEAAKHLPRR